MAAAKASPINNCLRQLDMCFRGDNNHTMTPSLWNYTQISWETPAGVQHGFPAIRALRAWTCTQIECFLLCIQREGESKPWKNTECRAYIPSVVFLSCSSIVYVLFSEAAQKCQRKNHGNADFDHIYTCIQMHKKWWRFSGAPKRIRQKNRIRIADRDHEREKPCCWELWNFKQQI